MAGGTCDIETDEIEFKWVIRQLSKVKILMKSELLIDPNKSAIISSNDFYTEVSNIKKVWNLKLECSPNSSYSIILNLHSGSSRFSVKLFILNDEGKKEKLSDETILYFTKSDDNYSYLIDQKYLSDGKYILGNTLTFICNLVEYGEPKTSELPSFNNFSDNLVIDIKTLLTTGEYSDVTLMVNGAQFNVHKTILSARSSVFAEMFSPTDRIKSQIHQVPINNTNSENVKKFLEFIYSANIEKLHDKQEFELWLLADQYKVESLKNYCEQLILYELTEETVIDVLERADSFKMQNLVDKTVDYFISHCKSMIKSYSDVFDYWRVARPCLFNLVLQRSTKKY